MLDRVPDLRRAGPVQNPCGSRVPRTLKIQRFCAIALTVASTIIGSAASAIAAPCDGNWIVSAQTTRGHCENIQFGLTIIGGRIYSAGGSYGGYAAQFGGRVSRGAPTVARAFWTYRSCKPEDRL